MSPIPQPPAVEPGQPPVGEPRSNALARTAMIFGILPILLGFAIAVLSDRDIAAPIHLLFFQAFDALAALVAIILGLVALSSIRKNPVQHGGRGMAITGITAACAAVFLAFVILPSLGRARPVYVGNHCAANLRGIAQTMILYAADNLDCYPYLGPAEVSAQPTLANTGGSLMHDMFSLVGTGQVAVSQFVCKSDPANVTRSAIPRNVAGRPPYTPTYWTNPSGGDPNFCFSYSFAYQYASPTTLGAWWYNTMDADLPIAADMNPGDQRATPPLPIRNSPNHGWQGQYIAYADGHVDFSNTPCAGEKGDHIYNTGIADDPAALGTIGQPPFASPLGNTPGSFDTCLVPGAADSNFTRK